MENNKEDKKPHFVKVIDYASKEPWRTDVIIGQKGAESHAHIVASGSLIYYLRDEQGREIIVNGVVKNISKEDSDSISN